MSANVVIQFRRGTASEWTSANPTLAAGEVGFETDTTKIKIGDGSTAWTSLDYVNLSDANLDDLANVSTSAKADGDFLRWNGTAWINDAVNLGTDSVGDYVESLVAGTGVTVSNNSGEGATPTVAIGQDVGTTDDVTFNTVTTDAGITVGGHILPDADVAYDLGSTDNRFRDIYLSGTTIDLGGVEITSDGTTVSIPSLSVTSGLTGDVTGNADSASALETARVFNLSGDVAGSVSFDGSADVIISTTVQPNSVAMGTDTSGNYVDSVTSGTGVTVSGGSGAGATPSIAIGQPVGTTDDVTFNSVSANLTGDVTGNADTASALETARTIQVSGDVAGSASFDGSANINISTTIQADSVALGTDTTGDYVQDITGGTGVTVSSGTGESSSPTIYIGQDVGTGASVTFATATTTGDVVVGGNLTVNGDTTTLNVSQLYVEDNIINLNTNQTGTPTLNAGIEVVRGDANNTTIRWDESQDVWEFTNDGTTYYQLATEINDISDVNADSPSNAEVLTYNQSAGEWQSIAPTVGAISDVTLTSTATGDFLKWNGTAWVNETIDLGTDTVGDYVQNLTAGTGVTLSNNSGEGASPTVAIGQAIGTTDDVTFNSVTIAAASPLVFEGATADDFEATITVTDPTADRTITIADASGTIALTSQSDGTIALGTDTSGDYVENLTAGTGVTLSNNTGEGASPTIAIGQDVSTTANVEFEDVTVNGLLDAGHIHGELAGPVYLHVKNTTGSTIAKGTPIYATGSVGASGETEIAPSNASTASTMPALGITTAELTANAEGHAVILGVIKNINTSSYDVNDVLYVAEGGGLTKTRPTGLDSKIQGIGRVIRDDASTGEILILGAGRANETPNDIEATRIYSSYYDIAASTYNPDSTPTHTEGRIWYDSTNKALRSFTSVTGVDIALGQEQALYVHNDSGVSIPAGSAVYFTGETSAIPTIALADASDGDKINVGGVAKSTIASGAYGFIIESGVLLGIDLSGFSVGDRLHLSPTTPGALQTAVPTYPNYAVEVAEVLLADNPGCFRVKVVSEVFYDIRVRSDARVGGDLTVAGNLTILGTQSEVSVNNLNVDDSWIYLNGGDTIATTSFSGTGLNDGTLTGHYSGTGSTTYYVRIDGVGTGTGGVDTFEWSTDNFSTTEATGVDIDTAGVTLSDGISIDFIAATGHTSGDTWSGTASPVNVDIGFAGNYNDSGYSHTGLFRDTDDARWKFFNAYDPELSGNVNTAHASFELSDVQASTFYGALSGNATTATTLETARTISLTGDVAGSVSFNGSGDVSISTTIQADSIALGTDTTGNYVAALTESTGVTITNPTGEGQTATIAIGQDVATTADVTFNTVTASLTGNVTGNLTGDVTGNADTATALATARTIQISGDVAGSASFDGTGDINISATVQADSVALGTDTTGNYTVSVSGGTGVTVTGGTGEGNTPSVAIGQAVGTSDDVTFNTVSLGTAPTQAGHAVTKSYVDNIAAGIDWHEAVALATATTLPDSPAYDNGSSGVGATLTSTSQVRLSIDGTNATTGDRVLVKNQATAAENGIYVVTNQGAAATAYWILTRADDFDGGDADINPGEAVFALGGSTNARQGFVVTSSSSPHTVGSDSISFTQFTGTQAFTAGTGLAQTGNTLNVGTASTGRIVVNADNIDLATVSVGSTSGSATSTFVSGVTTDSYGRVTSVETSDLIQGLATTDSPTFVTVTADLSGNATTATTLATARTIALSGDVTATGVSFDGSGNITLTTAMANDSVDLGTHTTGDYVASVGVSGTGLTVTGTGEGAAVTVTSDATNLNTAGTIVARDGTGNFSAGTITASLTGNVTGDVTGDVTGTVSDVSNHSIGGLSDVDMTTVAPSEGDITYFDGTNWVPYPLTIQNSGGVSTSSETSGDILLYNGTNYVNTAHTLANITNVTLTSEADGEFLKYNGTNWVNATVPIINALGDIGDVSFTSLASDEAIKYDGANWVNYDPLASPALTGTPTAPTAATTTNTTQLATTAFVQQELSALVDSAPATLDTLNELAAALGDDANFSTTVTNSLALKAPLASPTFTGTVTLPTGTSVLHDYDAYGANHTLVAGNEGHTLEVSATATITVPPNSSVAFPVGTVINIIQTGTGTATVAAGAGVTINNAAGLKTREQWSMITLHKRATDTWLVTGDAKA
jgi:hypothetical protein